MTTIDSFIVNSLVSTAFLQGKVALYESFFNEKEKEKMVQKTDDAVLSSIEKYPHEAFTVAIGFITDKVAKSMENAKLEYDGESLKAYLAEAMHNVGMDIEVHCGVEH